MSFLKELFNSIARTLGRIIAYALIGFIIFFVFSKFTNAQSLQFNRPYNLAFATTESNALAVNWSLRCSDVFSCGVLNDTESFDSFNLVSYRIQNNLTDTSITLLPKGSYSLSFTSTIQTVGILSSNEIDIDIIIYRTSGTKYSYATCDSEEYINKSKFPDISNRWEISYNCGLLENNLTDVSYIGFLIKAPTINYIYVSSTLKLIGYGEASNNDIIDNQNQNTQDIINNQNQNTQDIVDSITDGVNQTNDKLDDMLDSSVPSTDNIPTFEFNNGPISGLLTMPITWFNAFINPGTCRDISLGELLGTELKFECIDPEDFLGSSIWNTIDIFIVVMMIISIGSMILHIVDSFRNLNDMYDEYYTPKHQGYRTKHNGERV